MSSCSLAGIFIRQPYVDSSVCIVSVVMVVSGCVPASENKRFFSLFTGLFRSLFWEILGTDEIGEKVV